MTNFERAVDYIRTTVRQLPTGTASRFSVPRNVFRDVDQAGGARVDIELQVGQSRLFEIDFERSISSVVRLGQSVPSSYEHQIPVRVRYDSTGPGRYTDSRLTAKQVQFTIIDALHRNQWHNVTGLVHLVAEPSSVSSFSLTDDAGNEHVGFISETLVTFSHDI